MIESQVYDIAEDKKIILNKGLFENIEQAEAYNVENYPNKECKYFDYKTKKEIV